MALPAGVTTAEVTFGPALNHAGTGGTIEGQVKADRKLVWTATGETLYAVPQKFGPTAAGASLTFTVPHVDQDGFTDASGAAITGWAYTFEGLVTFGSTRVRVVKTFQVFADEETVDLDTVPDGPATSAVVGPSSADRALAAAGEAESSATAAASSASAAASSATAAESASATAAADAVADASAAIADDVAAASSSATAADTSATAAATARTEAEAAQTEAEAARDAAAASATAADTSADEAAASLTTLNAQKGAANGIAPLDSAARVPEANLPTGLASTTLATTYGRQDPLSHLAILDDMRRSKGGVIGTNGKPVVSFRIDHGVDPFLATFWPLFRDRGIPCTLGVVTDAVGNAADPYEPTTTTWAQLLAEHRKGFEVWSHSRSHRDPAVITGRTLTDEVVGSRQKLEAEGFKVFGWQQPGIPGVTTPHYSNNWTGGWSSEYGRLVSSTYGLMEMGGLVGGAMRTLPTMSDYDLGHYTLDSYNYTTAKGILDTAVGYGLSTLWMLHPRFISGGTVTATTADVTSFLDYIKTLWDAGSIEVLTASGLAFADPGTSRRLNLVQEGTFATQTTIPQTGKPWLKAGGVGNPTIVADAGGNYVHFVAADSFTYVYQGNTQVVNLRATGATFIAEGEARATVANTEARMTLLDGNDNTRLNYEVYRNLTAGAGWQKFRIPFSVPLATTNLQVRVSRRSGTGDIDWRNISIRPV